MELEATYIIFTLVMSLALVLIGFYVISRSFSNSLARRKKKLILVLSLIMWHCYVYYISKSGLLQNFDLPPRFFIFLVLPLFIFTGIFLYKNRNNTWLQNLPKTWPVFFQSFRIIIEIVFVFTVAQGFLHAEVTMEGYNYDIIFGVSALVVGFLMLKGKLANRIIIYWNYLGLVVIVFIIFLFLSTVFIPQWYGATEPLMPIAAVTYPFTLVAGFLMPSAVFMHVLSIVQLRKSR